MTLKTSILFSLKLILIILTIIVALLVYVNVNADEIIIPSSAIRFRVIANSNSINDQKIKIERLSANKLNE